MTKDLLASQDFRTVANLLNEKYGVDVFNAPKDGEYHNFGNYDVEMEGIMLLPFKSMSAEIWAGYNGALGHKISVKLIFSWKHKDGTNGYEVVLRRDLLRGVDL